jgi:hypothetical protein
LPLKELPVSPEYQNIMVVAGEASGDMHAAALVQALKRIEPKYRYYGVGGEKLRGEGVELVADSAAMAVARHHQGNEQINAFISGKKTGGCYPC